MGELPGANGHAFCVSFCRFLLARTVNKEGKPASLQKARYYVFYFTASTCPRCKVFTPKFVANFNQTLADRTDMAFVTGLPA
jgi:hypothetical protein